MKSHSFVLQFLQLLEILMAHAYADTAHNVSIKDTGGVSRTVQVGSTFYVVNYMAVEAVATTQTYGVMVGTGTNAPATDDYTLQTQIAHGSGAGQMQYGACSMSAAGIVGANVDLYLVRPFINGSGSTITLKEVGVVVSNLYSSNGQGFFLIAHDSVDQAVANTECALVSYDIRTTV